MNVPAGKNPPEDIYVVIEIPQDSRVKYEMDHDMDAIIVDRFAFTTMGYPANYGFVPNTKSGDGDPTDVLVLTSQPVLPGVVISAIPIGVLEMEDEGGTDEKIIAVPPMKVDPFFGIYKELDQVPDAYKNRIKHFFENYKGLEPGKWVKVKGFQESARAKEMIKAALIK